MTIISNRIEGLFGWFIERQSDVSNNIPFATQEPNESLGISVAGGLGNQRGDVPLYITNMQPNGCLARHQQVKVRFNSSFNLYSVD